MLLGLLPVDAFQNISNWEGNLITALFIFLFFQKRNFCGLLIKKKMSSSVGINRLSATEKLGMSESTETKYPVVGFNLIMFIWWK